MKKKKNVCQNGVGMEDNNFRMLKNLGVITFSPHQLPAIVNMPP
jgi:hypothetical protein